jgi:hypothetical protein
MTFSLDLLSGSQQSKHVQGMITVTETNSDPIVFQYSENAERSMKLQRNLHNNN